MAPAAKTSVAPTNPLIRTGDEFASPAVNLCTIPATKTKSPNLTRKGIAQLQRAST